MDITESLVYYKTLRNIFLDGKSNSIKLGLEHGMEDKEAEQAILTGVDQNYLKVVKDSDPREYTVNFDKLAEEWYNLWTSETGEEPVTPQNFESFLKGYIKSYMKNEKHSTLREMLVDEFHIGLTNQGAQAYLSNDFRELNERLGQNFKGKRSSGEHIKHGFDKRH